MRRVLMIASASVLAAMAIAAPAQEGTGGGPSIQRNYPVGGFDSVLAAGPHKVVVTTGGAAYVRAEGAADALERMEVVVEDGDLEIRPKEQYRNRSWSETRPATFYVSVPNLRKASIAGSGNMSVDRVSGDRFSASVAGSGELQIGSIRASDANFSVAGSGDLTARGQVGSSRLSIAGSGNLNMADLTTRSASVSVAGSGATRLNASERVSVSIIGSGDVAVTGTATCSVNRMGSGRVRCGS